MTAGAGADADTTMRLRAVSSSLTEDYVIVKGDHAPIPTRRRPKLFYTGSDSGDYEDATERSVTIEAFKGFPLSQFFDAAANTINSDADIADWFEIAGERSRHADPLFRQHQDGD